MDKIGFDNLYDEVGNDILAYAGSKLPDVDPVALSEVIAYTIHKCVELAGKIMTQKSENYMDILIEQLGKEVLENETGNN
jgi:hypothetical protein